MLLSPRASRRAGTDRRVEMDRLRQTNAAMAIPIADKMINGPMENPPNA
jgi:hypothetical protein